MSLSVYSEKKVLEHLLNVAAYTPPATLYLALFTSSAGLENNTVGSQTEVVGNGYARLSVTGATGRNFAVDATPTGYNNGQWDFSPASGGGWGTITHMAIMDASTTGNVLVWYTLTTPISPNDTDIVRVLSGQMVVIID